jgi:hypothetical protein
MVEILICLGLLAVLGGILVYVMRSGRHELQFSSDHLNAVILTQKLSEDLIEELSMNPYGLETLGFDTTPRNFQEIVDGRSVLFSYIEDRAPPWGLIDPQTDGTLDQQMKPLYDDIRKFKVALSGDRRASSGSSPDRNLVEARFDFNWPTKTGRGELTSTCLLFSPAAAKQTDLAYAVNEPAIDARIPREVFGRGGMTIPQVAAAIGENVETITALGRISLITRDFLQSDFVQKQKKKIADEKTRLARTPASALDRQYAGRLAIARHWYELAKVSFQILAYLVPHFTTLQQQGKFNQEGGTGFNASTLQCDLQTYRVIYETFAGSLIQARYYYYSLLASDLSQYKGGKVQLQAFQKLMDIYRVCAILPTRPQGMQEYKDFLARLKSFAQGRNPFLVRFIDQETIFLQTPSLWFDRLPNLKRIADILQDKIPGILAFIREKSAAAITSNMPK